MHRFVSRRSVKFVLLCCCILASTAFGHGDTHERIETLNALLKTDPGHVDYLLERADIHRRHRNFDEALDDLNSAKVLAPTNDTVFYLIGLTLFERGDFDAAENALHTFIGRSPSNLRGHLAIAKVYTQQNRHVHAAREYELVISHQSTPNPDHYIARARSYMDAGTPHLMQALQGLEEGIALIGPLITFRRLAIEIEIAQGNYQSAIDRVDSILQDVDRKETWLVKKANILSSIGMNQEATQTFLLAERAIQALPNRNKKSPAVRALQKIIDTNLKSETPVKDGRYDTEAEP